MSEYKDCSEDFVTIPDKGLFIRFPVAGGYYEVEGKSYLIGCNRLAHPIKHYIEEDKKINERMTDLKIRAEESIFTKIKRLFRPQQSKQ